MNTADKNTLLQLGFEDIGAWKLDGDQLDYELDAANMSANEASLKKKPALYAFVCEDHVKYIGKTARTIRQRFVGYRRPGKRQSTNIRCNAAIKSALERQEVIRILVFAPISDLRYLEFEIDLAAGLEDSLIRKIEPPWNGGKRGQRISEEAEREAMEEAEVLKENPETAPPPELPALQQVPLAKFSIRLGEAYYNQGIVNPGVEASSHIGKHGDPIEVCFDDGTAPVISRINRTANSSGAVRLVGHNRMIADWFHARFAKNDVAEGRVLDAHRILLLRPHGSAGPSHSARRGPPRE